MMSVDDDRFPVLQLRRGKNKSLSLQLLCNPRDIMGKTPTSEAPGEDEGPTQMDHRIGKKLTKRPRDNLHIQDSAMTAGSSKIREIEIRLPVELLEKM